jgi:hypothetical protein
MHKYRVIERWPEASLCALRCSSGRIHRARALNFLPPEAARLHGDKPHLGFGLLVCPASGAIYRLIFESINEAESALAARRMLSQPPVTQRIGLSAAGSGG